MVYGVVRKVHRVCSAVLLYGGGKCAMAIAIVSNRRVVRRKLWRQAGSWVAAFWPVAWVVFVGVDVIRVEWG